MSLIIYSMLLLVAFNLANVHVDAFKIAYLDKQIKHTINFAAYAGVTIVCLMLSGYGGWAFIIFCINAFVNRQLFFDIPLNLRRGLPWDYVSTADYPESVLDRLEIQLFGREGKRPAIIYALVFVVTTILLFIVS